MENNIFDKEYTDSLNRLYNDNSKLTGFKWFPDTAYSWTKKNSTPNVVILGTAIPEEILMAAGAEPYWLTGGSLGSIAWSDDLVPRDTDPVSRSILGYIIAVKVLLSICQQIWKTQQWPQDWKRSVFIPIPKKGNAKECSNYRTIARISHASK